MFGHSTWDAKVECKNLVWVTFACLIFCPTTLSKFNVKQGSSTTIVYEKYSQFVRKFLLLITIIIMEFLIMVFSWLHSMSVQYPKFTHDASPGIEDLSLIL